MTFSDQYKAKPSGESNSSSCSGVASTISFLSFRTSKCHPFWRCCASFSRSICNSIFLRRTVTDLGFSTADIASPPIHLSVSKSLVESAPLHVTARPPALARSWCSLTIIDCLHARRAERSFRLRLGFIVEGEREGGHNSDPALSDCGHI